MCGAHVQDSGVFMSVRSALVLSRTPAIGFAAVGAFWGAFATLVPELKAQIGASDGTFGMLLLGTSIGLLTTMYLAPTLDRVMGRWSMVVGAVALACAFLAPGLVATATGFFLAMVFCGMASGLLDVIMNARVSELETRHGRSLMNANHGIFSVAYAVSALGTGLAREASLAPVLVFAFLGVLVLIGATRFMMLPAAVEDAPDGAGRFPVGIVLLCGGLVMVAFMVEASVEAWSALHLERTLGGRAAEGALGPAMLGMTMAIGRFGGQAVSERMSDLTVVYLGTGLALVGVALVATAPVTLMAYAGFGMMGLGVSAIGPIGLALVGKLVPRHLRTKAIARAAVMGFMGFFLAPALMGLVSEGYGLRVAFAGVGLLLLALVPLSVLLGRNGA